MGLCLRGSNEMLLKSLKKVDIVKTENRMDKEDFKGKIPKYGQFVREMPEEIDKDLSWKWLVQSDLKVQTEATICAAQEQALRTNYTKNKIDKTSENPFCSECVVTGEKLCSI